MKTLRVGIIAGEASGDILGAALIRALRAQHPSVEFEGIAGPLMQAEGCISLFPMERLSVMGLVEVLKHLPDLLRIRRQVADYFLANPPDIFIGIDAPDFNLTVEEKLKKVGIKTVHYVSPTVWAWRRGRLKKIERAVDRMLTLLPFEAEFYRKNSVISAEFVGHPLADQISLEIDREQAKSNIGFKKDDCVIALMPGSRANEINYLGELFIQTAQWCKARVPTLKFIAPMINAKRQAQFTEVLKKIAPEFPLQIIEGKAHEVMAAADVVLLASGTATLEAMFLKCPMVVAYKMSPLTYFIARYLIKTPYIALPNLVANQQIVSEFIQGDATVENLGEALLSYIQDEKKSHETRENFFRIHEMIRHDAAMQAAKSILSLLQL